jgi:hypothetical protein
LQYWAARIVSLDDPGRFVWPPGALDLRFSIAFTRVAHSRINLQRAGNLQANVDLERVVLTMYQPSQFAVGYP